MAWEQSHVFAYARSTGLSLSELGRRGALARARRTQKVRQRQLRLDQLPRCPRCQGPISLGFCLHC
jgi:hypothetical protein